MKTGFLGSKSPAAEVRPVLLPQQVAGVTINVCRAAGYKGPLRNPCAQASSSQASKPTTSAPAASSQPAPASSAPPAPAAAAPKPAPAAEKPSPAAEPKPAQDVQTLEDQEEEKPKGLSKSPTQAHYPHSYSMAFLPRVRSARAAQQHRVHSTCVARTEVEQCQCAWLLRRLKAPLALCVLYCVQSLTRGGAMTTGITHGRRHCRR